MSEQHRRALAQTKTARQQQIVSIVRGQEVVSQAQLARLLAQEGMEVTTDVFKSTDKVLSAGMEPWRNHWRLLCECQENSLRMRHQLMR